MSEDLSRLSNENIINEIAFNEQRNQYLRRELQRRNDDRIEQLQLLIQRLSVRGTETSSQVAEQRAQEEIHRVDLEIESEPDPESEEEEQDTTIVVYQDDIRVRIRQRNLVREDGTLFQVPVIAPDSSLEGNGRFQGRTTTDGSARQYIDYRFPINLRVNRGNELISGTIVELLSRSGSHTTFANQTYAVVVGTSQHGQRVLVGRLDNRNRTTDSFPSNVLGPVSVEVEFN